MLRFLLDAGGAAAGAAVGAGEGATGAGAGGMLSSFMPLIAMVVIFYFLLIRPQRKRDKQATEMRNALEVGDEIITNGGVLGRVVSIHDDALLIETGPANTKMRIAKWAVQANQTPKAAAPAAKDEEKSMVEKEAEEAQGGRKKLFGRKKDEA